MSSFHTRLDCLNAQVGHFDNSVVEVLTYANVTGFSFALPFEAAAMAVPKKLPPDRPFQTRL
jgi:hypothetical protein